MPARMPARHAESVRYERTQACPSATCVRHVGAHISRHVAHFAALTSGKKFSMTQTSLCDP